MIGAGRRDKLTLIVFLLCISAVLVGCSVVIIIYLVGSP